MQAVRARITSKGQITLPKAVRESLGLRASSVVEFEVLDGQAVMRPSGSGFLARYGSVAPRRRPEDWKRVRSEVRKAIAHRQTKRNFLGIASFD